MMNKVIIDGIEYPFGHLLGGNKQLFMKILAIYGNTYLEYTPAYGLGNYFWTILSNPVWEPNKFRITLPREEDPMED